MTISLAISVLSPIFATALCCVLFIHFIYCLRSDCLIVDMQQLLNYLYRLHILELQSGKSKLHKTISNITWPTLTLVSK